MFWIFKNVVLWIPLFVLSLSEKSFSYRFVVFIWCVLEFPKPIYSRARDQWVKTTKTKYLFYINFEVSGRLLGGLGAQVNFLCWRIFWNSIWLADRRYSSVSNSGELHIEPKLVHNICCLFHQFSNVLFSESFCLFWVSLRQTPPIYVFLSFGACWSSRSPTHPPSIGRSGIKICVRMFLQVEQIFNCFLHSAVSLIIWFYISISGIVIAISWIFSRLFNSVLLIILCCSSCAGPLWLIESMRNIRRGAEDCV
jgi:hypothetical protein